MTAILEPRAQPLTRLRRGVGIANTLGGKAQFTGFVFQAFFKAEADHKRATL